MPYDESTPPADDQSQQPETQPQPGAAPQPGETVGPQQYAGEDELPPHPGEGATETAQGLGEVSAEGAKKIDVTDEPEDAKSPMAANVRVDGVIPHIPGVNSSEGDSKYVDPEASTTERDANDALEVSQWGHWGRSNAADIRRDIQAEKAFKDKLHEIVTDPRYLDARFRATLKQVVSGRWRNSEWAWGKRLPDDISDWALERIRTLEETHGRRNKENPDIPWSRSYDALRSSADVLNGDYDPTAPFRESDLERARWSDELAKYREDWAKLLQEKPISDAYREAHPEFKFGVLEMIELEKLIKHYEGREPYKDSEYPLDEKEFDNPENISFVPVVGELQKAISRLAENARQGDEELLSEYEQKITATTTTLGELVDLYKKVCVRNNGNIEARVEERKQVLEDVKSGRASQTPEPGAPEQVAA